MGSGLPSWNQLLDQLASRVSPHLDVSDEEWSHMDALSKVQTYFYCANEKCLFKANNF